MEKIDDELLEKLGKTSRILLKDSEKKPLAIDIKKIMESFSEIQKLQVGEETHYVTQNKNVLREDHKPIVCEDTEDIMRNVPKKTDGFVKVPKNL